jgi:hypothetical protein
MEPAGRFTDELGHRWTITLCRISVKGLRCVYAGSGCALLSSLAFVRAADLVPVVGITLHRLVMGWRHAFDALSVSGRLLSSYQQLMANVEAWPRAYKPQRLSSQQATMFADHGLSSL